MPRHLLCLNPAHDEVIRASFTAAASPTAVYAPGRPVAHSMSTRYGWVAQREAEASNIGQSTVSHHLKKLADVRFVLVDHDGNSSYYRVNERCVTALPTAAQLVMGQVPAQTGG